MPTLSKRRLKRTSALNHLHTKDLILREKLKKIFFLHTSLDGYYHLLFRAIFEIEKLYPAAYQVVVQYRHWLTTEVYKLLLTVKKDATKSDSDMFLFTLEVPLFSC